MSKMKIICPVNKHEFAYSVNWKEQFLPEEQEVFPFVYFLDERERIRLFCDWVTLLHPTQENRPILKAALMIRDLIEEGGWDYQLIRKYLDYLNIDGMSPLEMFFDIYDELLGNMKVESITTKGIHIICQMNPLHLELV